MLESFKNAGVNLGRELGRTWDNLSVGWRELFSQRSSTLTHLARRADSDVAGSDEMLSLARWKFMEGKIEETDNEVVVRVDMPGMEMECCLISIESKMLYVSGEKRYERDIHDNRWRTMERAYASFQRVIPLPDNVDSGKAELRYKNGVLTVRLPKVSGE